MTITTQCNAKSQTTGGKIEIVVEVMGVKAKDIHEDLCSVSTCPLPQGARKSVASQELPSLAKGFDITTTTNSTDENGNIMSCVKMQFKAS